MKKTSVYLTTDYSCKIERHFSFALFTQPCLLFCNSADAISSVSSVIIKTFKQKWLSDGRQAALSAITQPFLFKRFYDHWYDTRNCISTITEQKTRCKWYYCSNACPQLFKEDMWSPPITLKYINNFPLSPFAFWASLNVLCLGLFAVGPIIVTKTIWIVCVAREMQRH